MLSPPLEMEQLDLFQIPIDFTIEVDSEHGKHGARQFNIHKGGGGENTRYIHQIYGDSSQHDAPENAEYSDSESESDDDFDEMTSEEQAAELRYQQFAEELGEYRS